MAVKQLENKQVWVGFHICFIVELSFSFFKKKKEKQCDPADLLWGGYSETAGYDSVINVSF